MKRTLAAVSILAFSVSAAWSQDKPKPPPAWHQGKPAAMKDSKLAPLAGKMTETAPGDIPLDKLKVPAGFKVELWAHGLPGGRAMTRGDKGTVWVGTRTIGRVYEVKDEGGKRSVRVLADKLTQPAGVAYSNGDLYVFAIDKVLRYDGIEKGSGTQPVDLTAKFNLPPEPSRSARTRSSTCRSARRATSASRPRSTRRSGATTATAPAWR
jgi:glucose/arabinose dehydrogenase